MSVATPGIMVMLALTLLVSPMAWPASAQAAAQSSATDAWQSFEASLSATGRQEVLAVEEGRSAFALRLTGALVVTRSGGLGKGFRAEFLGFDDGTGTGTARAVWTDDKGDRIFSRMVGAPMHKGRRTEATITGGTGRYAGLTGTYTFAWQYLLPGEQDVVHVRVSSIQGRYRLVSPR